jgi:RimJ/RimL family protein N-acetyltransferase
MSTGEVILREVEESDLPIFYEHQADPVAYTLADFPPRDRDAFFAHWAKRHELPTTLQRTIVVDGQVVGHVQSFVRDGVQEVGYWLGRESWGRGYASAALAQFLPLMPVRPLYAKLAKANIGSRRVLEKAGFTVIRDEDGDLFMQLDGSIPS